MKNIVFLGSIYPDGYIEELLKIGSQIDFPSHNFQDALISGLKSCNLSFHVITALKASNFPKINKLFIKDKKVDFKSGAESVMVGRLNLPLLHLFYKYVRVKHYLKQLLKENDENMVIIYGAHTPFMRSVLKLKKRYEIKSCLIIPDLPEFMSSNQNKFFRLAKFVDSKLINKSIRQIDCFAPLSPLMHERLPYGDKPWVQVEGVYDDTTQYKDQSKSDKKAILYTGKIDIRYGIIELLDAFSLIDESDYELWIRGNGDALFEVKRRSELDKRIKLFPQMAKGELVKIQKSATLLINPLSPKEQFAKYFFPSKTLEYMGSGTPTLMFRLPCLPPEYDEYIYYFNDDTLEGMSNRIVEICEKSLEDRNAFGAKAREFVIREKNGYKQAKKIVDLLNSIK